jgi:hypothetical protein
LPLFFKRRNLYNFAKQPRLAVLPLELPKEIAMADPNGSYGTPDPEPEHDHGTGHEGFNFNGNVILGGCLVLILFELVLCGVGLFFNYQLGK